MLYRKCHLNCKERDHAYFYLVSRVSAVEIWLKRSNLRSGVIFFSLALLFFHAPPKKERLIAG